MTHRHPPSAEYFERSDEAIFRYQVVSSILVRERNGETRAQAINAMAAITHATSDTKPRKVSARTLRRWLKAFESKGFTGLSPATRQRTNDSEVLAPELLAFFERQKLDDPRASVPELIRRATANNLIPPFNDVDRTTVWRALKRMGIDTTRRKIPGYPDCRRFSFPHRMDMVLCDGKHFRAGVARLRRVALFFLDDATRTVLGVVVGTSESAQLFLRGVFESIQIHGLMSTLYVDNGSGFISTDAIDVLRNLGVLFIHGTPGYPEGRGKIERFNQTATEQLFRFLDNNPDVNPDCSALELRVRHYLDKQYNRSPHESLGGLTPWFRFQHDRRPLRFHENEERLRKAFVLRDKRRVSRDNVVSLFGRTFELPPGYAGTRIILHRNLLDDSVAILHRDRLIRLAPPNLHANARDKRAKPQPRNQDMAGLESTKSSAQILFNHDLSPVVDADGGFSSKKEKP